MEVVSVEMTQRFIEAGIEMGLEQMKEMISVQRQLGTEAAARGRRGRDGEAEG